VVVRVGRDGCIRNSAPCMDCATTLKTLNIKKIVYSNEDGMLSACKINNYNTEHVTTSRKLKLMQD